MKTIEQVVFQKYIDQQSKPKKFFIDPSNYIDWAQIGAKEAQRWITLEEELPPKTNPETPYSEAVLIKDESGDHYVAVYIFKLNMFDILCDVIIGWRPIERRL